MTEGIRTEPDGHIGAGVTAGFRTGGGWLGGGMFKHQAQAPASRMHARDLSVARGLVREAAIREALGRWVSELEPVLVYNQDGRFIGLTHAGQPFGGQLALHVEIRGGVPI